MGEREARALLMLTPADRALFLQADRLRADRCGLTWVDGSGDGFLNSICRLSDTVKLTYAAVPFRPRGRNDALTTKELNPHEYI